MNKYRLIIGLAVVMALLSAAWFASGVDSGTGGIVYDREPVVNETATPDPEVSESAKDKEGSEKSLINQEAGLSEQADPLQETGAPQGALEQPGNDSAQVAAAHQQATSTQPVEEVANTEPPSDSFTVTLSVRCDTILFQIDQLAPEKRGLVPPDGIIFPITQVQGYPGENAFNILQREMKKARIQLEFTQTPLYNSAYIESINNLYEFDMGELSGWLYKVNGVFPGYGCSRYQIESGDVIEFLYSCDWGYDIGGQAAREGQQS